MRSRAWRVPTVSICFGLFSGMALGQWETLAGGVSDQIRTFCVLPGEEQLLVGGNFPWLNIDTVRVNNIAAWNGTAWSTAHTGGGNGSTLTFGNTTPVLSLVSWNDTLFAGFGNTNWHEDPDIAFGAFLTDDTIWHALPARPNGPVFFSALNGRLFMGGNANELDSLPFPGVCEVIGGGFVPLANNPMEGADIWAYEYWHEAYYFGGQINSEYVGSRNILSYDGVDEWLPLAQGIGGNFVRSIRGYGDSLYVGGYFLPGNNVQSTHLQIWDGEVWHPFFPDVVEFIGQVFKMEVYEDALWILGTFHFSPSGPDYAILRYDGHQLCAIGGSAYQTGSGSAMTFFQGCLYKGMGAEYPGLEFEHIARLPLAGLVPDECYEVVTNVQEQTGKSSISLYPNPATDQLTISGLTVGQGGVIDVLDMLGKPVRKADGLKSPSIVLDIARLPAGFYQLKISSGSSTVVKRFAKQ